MSDDPTLSQKIIARAALYPFRSYFLVSETVYMALIDEAGAHPLWADITKSVDHVGRVMFRGLTLTLHPQQVTVFPERVPGEAMSELKVVT